MLICWKDTWNTYYIDFSITLTSSSLELWEMGNGNRINMLVKSIVFSSILILPSPFIHLSSLSSTVMTLFGIKFLMMFRIISLNISTYLSTSIFLDILDQSKESTTCWIKLGFAFWYCHSNILIWWEGSKSLNFAKTIWW